MRKNTCVVKKEELGPVNNKTDVSLEITSFLQQFDSEHVTHTMYFLELLKNGAKSSGMKIETGVRTSTCAG